MIPSISNYLVSQFFEENKQRYEIKRDDLIDLTRNFCHWLLTNSYTDISNL